MPVRRLRADDAEMRSAPPLPRALLLRSPHCKCVLKSPPPPNDLCKGQNCGECKVCSNRDGLCYTNQRRNHKPCTGPYPGNYWCEDGECVPVSTGVCSCVRLRIHTLRAKPPLRLRICDLAH